jgi:hypothetical protein
MRGETPFLAGAWAEAVFHVLAHVGATAHLASSVYGSAYVAAARGILGPAEERLLGEDARLLGGLLSTFASLARAQSLAWLFRSIDRASACAGRDLGALTEADVDAPELLPSLAGEPAVEILRAAAELELPLLARLPPMAMDLPGLGRALDALSVVAPVLPECPVGVVRALRLRGRVMGREIWVGEAPIEHAAWQAAHEATVAEVVERLHGAGERAGHDRVEGEAVALLRARARAAGLGEGHAAWWSCFGGGV